MLAPPFELLDFSSMPAFFSVSSTATQGSSSPPPLTSPTWQQTFQINETTTRTGLRVISFKKKPSFTKYIISLTKYIISLNRFIFVNFVNSLFLLPQLTFLIPKYLWTLQTSWGSLSASMPGSKSRLSSLQLPPPQPSSEWCESPAGIYDSVL